MDDPEHNKNSHSVPGASVNSDYEGVITTSLISNKMTLGRGFGSSRILVDHKGVAVIKQKTQGMPLQPQKYWEAGR
jgi:hypothetical protein